MNQKVWVIDDPSEKQVSASKINQRIIPVFQQNSTTQRSPSLAYSLSLIIWGCGQFYNRQWKLGILFLLLMINFYLSMGIIVIYRESIKSFFEAINVNYSEPLLIFGFVYLLGLIVWHFNAWQAYLKSIKINARYHKDIKMTLFPAVCSLLVPGWGQALNGQTKKGLFFQLFGLTGLATLPFILIIFLVWPTLEASRSRLIIEWIFAISIFLSPIIIMMWILNIYDAVKVSIDNTIKESLPIRFKYATNRFRYHIQLYGWKHAVLPLIRRNILIILLLIFCVITYHSVPKKFYVQQLQNLGHRMSEKEMTVIPSVIKKLLNNINLGN
jgi:hypothetical protein